ncbi:hypothetical protein AAII07_07600 [Microvirga sp. 0TCS3.31]
MPGGRFDGRLERPRIHGFRCQAQHVAGPGTGDDSVPMAGRRVGLEPTAQVADVRCSAPFALAGAWSPQTTRDEVVRGHDLVALDDQPRQHGALASPAEVHDRAIPRGRERAEHVQVEFRLPVHPTSVERPAARGLLAALKLGPRQDHRWWHRPA